ERGRACTRRAAGQAHAGAARAGALLTASNLSIGGSMRQTAKVVIGANYGDEGKGLMTDYHAAHAGGDGIVVRFNGGAQAGHTVTTPGGMRHVFSHLGSGTLAGAATFLSRHFVCHPPMFFKELEKLAAAGLRTLPPVFVDERAPVS